jgi:ADP-heptose:LPS heptosyltransferase
VLWGPGEEGLAKSVADASGGASFVAPTTGLADVVAILREARLMISGDTGPTHIAGAVGTPIVALFGPTTPGRNGPWFPYDISISRYDACDCHYQRVCRRDPSRWCLGSITEDDVRSAIDRRLQGAVA